MDVKEKSAKCKKSETIDNEDSRGCTECGEEIAFGERNIVGDGKATRYKFLNSKRIVIPIILIIALLVGYLTWKEIGKNQLKTLLLQDWSRIEKSDLTEQLDFSENSIELNYNNPKDDSEIKVLTMDYKIIAPNKIKVDSSGKVYTLDFNKDKTMMTITPALTSVYDSEYWYNLN